MAVLKCKMCGGSMEIQPGSTIGECQYCGTLQTLPRLKDDRRANLLNRANHYRRSSEFDKATSLYEQILSEDDSDAEVYWALVLCRYGIKYEKDPASGRQLPTINRMQYASILSDADYKAACIHADAEQRKLYVSEAKRINEIQKQILAISSREAPFDVFISYKEKDEKGERTLDSVLATDLYEYLTKENLKVFLSRITLEDKLGTEYEPYIFAALNSAKVMVVVGTRPENFNAVWVKNEWSRYLALIRKGEDKTLIPAFRDMDPYDLPEEFSNLVAQDMAKIGFKQDLKRGIMKIIGAGRQKTEAARTVVTNGPTLNTQLKRGYMALEDRDWSGANGFFDKALDMDPECAEAYLGKALADGKQSSLSAFAAAQMHKRPESAEKAFCDADEDFIHSSAQTNAVPFYFPAEQIVERFGQCRREYEVWSPGWERLLSAEKAYWNGDRYMSRALRFAKGRLADSLRELRQRSERYLEQSLKRSREEDLQRLRQCEQSYSQALDETEQYIRQKSISAAETREADFQDFFRQMQSAKAPEELEALQKKELPGLAGYRTFDQLRWQCGESAKAMRSQAAAIAADQERRRREDSAREQQKRERKQKKRRRQGGMFKFVGVLYYIYVIGITILLFTDEDTFIRSGPGVAAAVFLVLLGLRSYYAGSSGGTRPFLSGLALFSLLSFATAKITEAKISDMLYYSPYVVRMMNLLNYDDAFAAKFTAVGFAGSLLVILICGAIGKSVGKSLSKY